MTSCAVPSAIGRRAPLSGSQMPWPSPAKVPSEGSMNVTVPIPDALSLIQRPSIRSPSESDIGETVAVISRPARRYFTVTSPSELLTAFCSDSAPSIFVSFIWVMTSPLRSPVSSAGERSASLIGRTPVMTTPSVLKRMPRGVPAAMRESRFAPETLIVEKIIIAVKKTVNLSAALFFVIFPLSGGMFFHKRSADSFMRYFFVPLLICDARIFLCLHFV